MSSEDTSLVEFLFENLEKNKSKILLLEDHIETLQTELKEKHKTLEFYKISNHYLFLSNLSFCVSFSLLYIFRL